jgi:signal transduction histidine kinase
MDAPTIGLLLLPILFGLAGFWLGYNCLDKKVKDLACYKVKLEKLKQDFDALKKADEELQLKYLNATYSVQEEERKRIANDLHDEIGSNLTFLKLNIQTLHKGRRLADSRMIGEEQLFYDVFSILDEVNKRNREIIYDISPTVLEEFGLEIAINKVLERLNYTYSLRTRLEKSGEFRRLESRTELMLYRVVQELVTNAIKYSEGWQLVVTLNWEEAQLVVKISQFDRINNLNQGKNSHGLSSVLNRIKMINASIDVNRSYGETEYIIIVPYVRKEN